MSVQQAAPPRRSRLGQWLDAAPPPLFAAYAGVMAFGTYFSMYAFRKPYTAAHFSDIATIGGVDFKIALVIAQVIGYALAKFIGVKVIAELPAHRRIIGIALQIALAEASLIGFALIPPPWNVVCLFLDGLSLGMVWGMVFGFVEGRRQTDMIGAMLCASFILSSGVVKSVGQWVMLHQMAGQFWMPAVTGALFAPVLVLCLAGLAVLPPPNARDIAERVERKPMDSAARGLILRRYGAGLVALVLLYVMLTALRDFRDDFGAEIYQELGLGQRSEIFATTDFWISMLVLLPLGSLTLIRDSRRGLIANFAMIGLGLVIAGCASAAFALHLLGPVAWMIALGGGIYLAYVPFNGMLFDHLVAATGTSGNAGFLIYVADTGGYTGTVLLLMIKNFSGLKLAWGHFLIDASIICCAVGVVLLCGAALWFHAKLREGPA